MQKKCSPRKLFLMDTIFFAVVMLHLLIGFGWVLYKIGFAPKKKQ